ncbi:lysylphosphatidylglycerol synthase transmembrane domain-containing protein [Roseicyclus marinus]|uniref:lysylphosphatidylglycerol synthase transmembrane domain-containing protein n=1 Tax=Roseicyclus marinus TaxID=2161673 RepID=UPI00240FF257|nr:lysylphosphatidylglycerol synthase transmembrane domain-containing protein [Roseicyclus marinus]MDG3040509.1 lysylphosphatidylglycerol synthase transmembrane domain-containing protein [Roseicyclus marinus]
MDRLRRLPSGFVRAVQIAVAVGLMAWLWQAADGAEAARHLAGAQPVWLFAALAALTAQTILSALRWRVTAAQLGIAIDGGTAVREYYLSQIVNQALPGGVLGDAGRAVRARAQAGLLASGQAVAFERLAGQIAIFALLVVAFVVTLAVPGGLDWPVWAIWPVASVVGLGVAVPSILWSVARVAPGAAGAALIRLGQNLRLCLFAPEVRGRQLILSLGTAFANVAGFMCCAAAIGAPIPPGAALALVPLILFTMVIPITISGWGLREGAAAALLPLAGLTAAEAMAASVAFGLVFLASSLPGIVVVLLDRPRRAI